MKNYSKNALSILKKYSPSEPDAISPSEWEILKNEHLAFDRKIINHDEIEIWAIENFKKCKKKTVTDSFLIGIERDVPQLRAVLPAYSVMLNFKKHDFYTELKEHFYCLKCGLPKVKEIDLTFINSCRWTGSLVSRTPEVFAWYIEQHNNNAVDQPSESGENKFIELLKIISSSPNAETPSSLRKKLKKQSILKLNDEKCTSFIELLGYCGILQPKDKTGFLESFVGINTPSKTHSSDWAYPVDFWTGEDGVNKKALEFWFSEYPAIMNWIIGN